MNSDWNKALEAAVEVCNLHYELGKSTTLHGAGERFASIAIRDEILALRRDETESDELVATDTELLAAAGEDEIFLLVSEDDFLEIARFVINFMRRRKHYSERDEPVAWMAADEFGNTQFVEAHFVNVAGGQFPFDNPIPLYLRPVPPVSDKPVPVAWIEALKHELLFAAAKSNFTFSRDEVMQLLRWNLCPTTNANAEMERDAVIEAAKNLVKVKGRHHSQLAMTKLMETVAAMEAKS